MPHDKESKTNLSEIDELDQDESMDENLTIKLKPVKKHKCPFCDKHFTRKETLNKHKICVHEEKKPFKCVTCSSNFSSKHNLKTHVLSVHEGVKPFECDICGLRVSLKGTLKRHILKAHH